ncbi:MAG: ferredoxin reductase family protein [Acidimicrobiales bacterium]
MRAPDRSDSPPRARRPGRWSGPTRSLAVVAALYTVVVLVPLFVILAGSQPPERGFWVEFGVALGFIGLAMLCLQSVLTARYPRLSGVVGQDTMLQFHRQTGIVAFGFVLAHPAVLLLADSAYWEFLDPRAGFLRAIFLIFVVFALPALIVTSLWREAFRLPYQWWRLGHGALALMILLVGLVHITRVHYYLADPWKQALWLAMGTASMGSILYVRALKPLRVRRHPYRVVEVAPAAARTWRITLAPEHGEVLDFRAGQFAFLTLADTPFGLEQHPFSVASSAEQRDRLEFAVKELGDYTATIGTTPIGQVGFVDGPYGSLHLPDDTDAGMLMIAGGIGISPVIGMLRTLGDRGHDAPVVLLYAADTVDDLAYDHELDVLTGRIPLTVVRVLLDPPADWEGERGLVDAALIDTYLSADDATSWHAVVCGPPPMMDAAERALRRRGMPLRRIHSERFDIGAAGAVGRRSIQVRRLVLALSGVMVTAAASFALSA